MPRRDGVTEADERRDPSGPRVVVLADTDSYVKWGAALASRMPSDWSVELVVARSTALPSDAQIADAVSGTMFEGRRPPIVGLADLRALLRDERPDVVVLAARGYTVQAAVSVVENAPDRPVLVTGLPGVGVPVLPYGLGFRRASDVFVVHSHRELREFDHASRRLGLPLRFELARLPYLPDGPAPEAAVRDRVVFAAQALVPSSRGDREWLVERLADLARNWPDLQVVVKVRAAQGEAQTHHEQVPYEGLVDALEDRPANLVVETGPMHRHLDRAVGLVTVSSTALLEAVAAGVPALALDDFGVGVEQINLALRGSGLLGDVSALLEQRYARPDSDWADDNYLHDPAADTWIDAVEGLLVERSERGLPPYATMPGRWRDGFRTLLYRHFAFLDGTPREGLSAVAERTVVQSALWLNQHRSRFLRWGVLRAILPSAHGAKAMAFARENSQTAPTASTTRSNSSDDDLAPERVGPARTTAGL